MKRFHRQFLVSDKGFTSDGVTFVAVSGFSDGSEAVFRSLEVSFLCNFRRFPGGSEGCREHLPGSKTGPRVIGNARNRDKSDSIGRVL